mmetsp:Transcript_25065/g.27801  ORF Transcript_25065/g.27801 Transcript_25065/m.27801 type:complete len:91 (+) Transcript_25065:124-396(+)
MTLNVDKLFGQFQQGKYFEILPAFSGIFGYSWAGAVLFGTKYLTHQTLNFTTNLNESDKLFYSGLAGLTGWTIALITVGPYDFAQVSFFM